MWRSRQQTNPEPVPSQVELNDEARSELEKRDQTLITYTVSSFSCRLNFASCETMRTVAVEENKDITLLKTVAHTLMLEIILHVFNIEWKFSIFLFSKYKWLIL